MSGSVSIGAWKEQAAARTAARAGGASGRAMASGAASKGSFGIIGTRPSSAKTVTVVGLPSNSFTFEEMAARRGRMGAGGGSAWGGGGGGGGSAAVGLTGGAAPAVVKVISFGRGGTRATAMGLYVLRDDVVLENQNGQVLNTQAQVNEEMKAWAQTFDARAESDDVVKVRLWLMPLQDQTAPVWKDAASRESSGEVQDATAGGTSEGVTTPRIAACEVLGRVVAAGFAGHRYAYAMGEDQAGRVYADVVSVMVSRHKIVRTVVNKAGQSVEKTYPERLQMVSGDKAASGRRALNEASEKLLFDRISQGSEIKSSQVRLQVSLPGHGVSGAQNKLDRLLQKGAQNVGEVRTETGAVIRNVAETARLAKSWKRDMHSHGVRDVMHAMISARANENVESFKQAVRVHLKTQFGDHKYMFAIHTDKAQGSHGHIHAHVLVAVKSQSGVRYNPNKQQLLDWREKWAEAARGYGLRIVATQAMTQANTQTYGDRDKAIIEVAERARPERAEKDQSYARREPQVVEAARRRVEMAQSNVVKVPVTPEQRVLAERSFREWLTLQAVQPFNKIVVASLTRLEASIKSYDHAEQAARLDPEQLARPEASEGQAAAIQARQAELQNEARKPEVDVYPALLAKLPMDTQATLGEPAQPMMPVAQILVEHSRNILQDLSSKAHFGRVKTGELDEKGEPKMTLSAAKMKADLVQANQDIASLSGMLSGADKMEFDQRAAAILTTLTGVTKIQAFKEETGRDTVTRAEFFEIVGPAATHMLDVDRLARERAEKQAIVTRDAERLQEMAVQRVQRDAGNPTRDAAIIKQTENDRRVMRDTDKLVEETRQPSRAERAEAEIDRISSDTSLSFQEKLDALRKIDHPNDTFDPEKHRSKPAVSPEQQIVENVREYERQHPELNQKHTKKHKMK